MTVGQAFKPDINSMVRPESLTNESTGREFRSNYRDVEAPSPLAVGSSYAPPRADVGSASRAGCALPDGLARAYPSLSFSN
jgi:hypothetical protein